MTFGADDIVPLVVLDATGTVVRLNALAAGLLPVDAVGASFESLLVPSARPLVQCMARDGWQWSREAPLALLGGRSLQIVAAAQKDGSVTLALHDVTDCVALNAARHGKHHRTALGQVATSVVRELNDPMSVVQGRLELLLDLGVTDPDVLRRHLEVAVGHARRVSATLRGLRVLGQGAPVDLETVDLVDVVVDARGQLGARGATVVVDVAADLAVAADGAVLARVVANVLRHFVGNGASATRAVGRSTRSEVRLELSADGRVRDADPPDNTVDAPLIRAFGGELSFRRTPTGQRVDIMLPLPPSGRRRRRAESARLLVVGGDDFARTVATLLADDGFDLVRAERHRASVDEALAPRRVDAAIVDVDCERAPSGLGVARALVDTAAVHGPVVLVVDDPLEATSIRAPGTGVVRRPLQRVQLLAALGRRVVSGRGPPRR